MSTKSKFLGNSPGNYNNNRGSSPDGSNNPRQRNRGKVARTNTSSASSKFVGLNQSDLKGIVIDHSIDHCIPGSQRFDVMFYKAAKIAAGKIDPDLSGPMRTLEDLVTIDFEATLPDLTRAKKQVERKRYKNDDLQKMFPMLFRQLSSGITKKLKSLDDWKTIEAANNMLSLMRNLQEICYRDN
eukprot:jgi/Psemu1/3953/gm1.3953_g